MEAKKIKPIIIDTFQRGIAVSPHDEKGFAYMRNFDPSLIPGILLISIGLNKVTGSLMTTTLPLWAVMDKDNSAFGSNTIFTVDNAGSVFRASNLTNDSWSTWTRVNGSVTYSNGEGNGLAIWKNYLFVMRDTALDCYGPLTGAAATGTISGSGTAITGVGTAFTTEFTVGDAIIFGAQIRYVTVITDNTHLTVNSAFSAQPSGDTAKKINWTTGFKTSLSSDITHPMVAGQDDILYIGGGVDDTNRLGATIMSLQQVTGKIFLPSDTSTYSWNASALQLPYPYRITCLAELGQKLEIGTSIGGYTTNGTNQVQKFADIFPWDRHSATFDLPIRLFEQGTNSMLNVQNKLYIQAGLDGQFYSFDGYLASQMFKFPTNIDSVGIYQNTTVYAQGMMYQRQKIYFGMSRGTTTTQQTGVYSINLDGSGLTLENTTTGGDTVSNQVGCILSLGAVSGNVTDYLAGWKNGLTSTAGIDILLGSNNYNGSYGAWFDSPFYQIGTYGAPGTWNKGEIYLDQALQSNEGYKVYYRFNQNDAFTLLFTFDYATWGARRAYDFSASVITGDQVQIRVTATATTTTPRLKRLIFYPNA